ncbi:NAD(P)H-dependent oxidoreductase [Streptomyces sp. HNM0574]|uniref:NAD(P)H-dependent oxidoreductase n=1 Tax=Streptomyces sp. HNM0574 TaxID=2714954 RepID=UPI00146BA1D0|nr:NAD(P)H-dependent oxidoreductase [Streptomyces sp. HNM0574]NLU70904.1 NAD(P)H-dependent oxidoreductase [Streptomyces sp. HNM0574]
MKILWVFAHPEQRSLNASLMADGLRVLAGEGHDTRVSDLYAMGWNPVLDAPDVRRTPSDRRLYLGDEQERAWDAGELGADIRAEQDKLRWADGVVLHFPLWWHGPPAVLKGWFDRVFTKGFAFGVKDAEGRARRYGDGGLAGKRSLIVTSVGAREASFGPGGIHGHIDDILFPLQHGTFWYTGMAPLEPFVVYGADRLTDTEYAHRAHELGQRLRGLPEERPVPYRTERGGDYDDDLVLKPHLARRGAGPSLHLAGEGCSVRERAERPLVEQEG